MANPSGIFSGIYFDAAGMDALTLDLRASALAFQVEVDKTVAEVGEEIKESAKVIVSKHSKSIGPTIRVEMVPGAAEVHAGGGDNALAALYELGNKKGGKRKGNQKLKLIGPVTAEDRKAGAKTRTGFAHPVFGDMETWVTQESFPFLRPALAVNRRVITKRMQKAWGEALAPLLRED